MTKTYTLVVLAILVLGSVALAAGQNQFDGGASGAPADDTTGTTGVGPAAPAQYASAYPPPTIVVVPASQPNYPPPAYMQPQADEKGTNPLSIVGAILGIAAVVTIAVALLVQNAQRGAEANRPNDGPAFGTSTAQLGMMEGPSNALTIAPSGAVSYVTGNRPANTAAMPGANPAAAAPAVADAAQLAVITAALAAAGVATPTPAQLVLATNTVVNNWAAFGRNAAARQTAANAAVQAALRGAGLI